MKRQIASCSCGQLRVAAAGDPVRVSVCHCLDCKKRSGSAFSVQARWPAEQVTIEGSSQRFTRIGDSGKWAHFHFCPKCGVTVHYEIEALPGLTAVPLGLFEDPFFVSPNFSVYEDRKHSWLAITGDDVDHFD